MTVISYREVIPRTFTHKFGESPTAERKFVVTVDSPTPTQDVISAIGVLHTSPHPEFPYLKMLEASVSESDRHHVEVSYKYEFPKQEDLDPNPLMRPDVWSFSVGGVSIPTFMYYGDDDRQEPLTNSAGEFLEGASTDESEVRATVSGNRASFPLAIAAYVTNTLNDDTYLGCPKYTWKCAGISGSQASEVVNGAELYYYQISVELVYRTSGWPLILADVGYNELKDGRLERCHVELNGDSVASANPIALDSNGSMLTAGLPPRLLVRRVHRAVPFSTYFGEPQF
jgi:hypothetical protein